jgi:hypothetical protein
MLFCAVYAQGLSVTPTVEGLYLDETNIGPFLPGELYKLIRLDLISIKKNFVIGKNLCRSKSQLLLDCSQTFDFAQPQILQDSQQTF